MNSYELGREENLSVYTNVFRTNEQTDHYRAFATMLRALIICYMFFNINVPFESDYFVLISQHNLSVFSFRGFKN